MSKPMLRAFCSYNFYKKVLYLARLYNMSVAKFIIFSLEGEIYKFEVILGNGVINVDEVEDE